MISKGLLRFLFVIVRRVIGLDVAIQASPRSLPRGSLFGIDAVIQCSCSSLRGSPLGLTWQSSLIILFILLMMAGHALCIDASHWIAALRSQ